jgi:hypothetical protein
LEDSNIVLSPHWREIDPRKARDTAAISLNYKHGVFNGGFVGVNRKATDFLDWWFASCVALPNFVNKSFLFVDQKFLDVVPVYFENVHILKHKGCNVSEWNEVFLERSVANNRVMINGKDELVFAHFANSYIIAEVAQREAVLMPFYKKYQEELSRIKQELGKTFFEGKVDSFIVAGDRKKYNINQMFRRLIYTQAKKIVDRAEQKK